MRRHNARIFGLEIKALLANGETMQKANSCRFRSMMDHMVQGFDAFEIHMPPVEYLLLAFYRGSTQLSGLAYWTLPHKISAPSVEDLIKVLHRGCVTFK